MNTRIPTWPLLLVLLLPGCVNLAPVADQTRHFSLGKATEPTSAEGAGRRVYIARPELPGYLLTTRLVYRRLNGEIAELPATRWAEPLPDGVARTLAEELSEREAGIVFNHFPWLRIGPDTDTVSVHLRRFAAAEDGRVRVAADWFVRSGGSEAASGSFASDAHEWTVGDPASLVAALNAALAELAGEMAVAFE